MIEKKCMVNKWILALVLGLGFCLLFGGCTLEDASSGGVLPISTEHISEVIGTAEEEHTAGKNEAYIELENNIPSFTEKQKRDTEAFEKYSKLDSLGRCGVAFANICKEIMPTEKRGEIGSVKPSGWHTVKYNGLVDGNYLYNRCHLIGYQLAGENANEKNLITGTRYLNVEGMLPFEDQVAEYVKKTGHHVLYRVTPCFSGNDLVAKGVEMEAYSVEDRGKGVSFHIFAYNIQPGVEINYATGESHLTEESVNHKEETDKKKKDQTQDQKTETGSSKKNKKSKDKTGEEQKQVYILNTNTKKFHAPNCSSVSDIHTENRKKYKGTREKLLKKGYEPCMRCRP